MSAAVPTECAVWVSVEGVAGGFTRIFVLRIRGALELGGFAKHISAVGVLCCVLKPYWS